MLDHITTAAKQASRQWAVLSSERKNHALHAMAEALWDFRAQILAANELDYQAARFASYTEAKLDRLFVNDKRIQDMAEGLRQVATLKDPIGETMETIERPNGLKIVKVRVPMGVIAIIYESRPNVTVDAAGLALKTGNAVILRGGKEAINTNIALTKILRGAILQCGITPDGLQIIENITHESVDELLRARGSIDLIIPRGGAGLIQHVVEHSLVPVIETGVGNCHVYVDEAADLAKAMDIIMNAKTQRPSVCNAIETVLVHDAVAKEFLPMMANQLIAKNVQLRVCERSLSLLKVADIKDMTQVQLANEFDYETEFLDLILAVRVVRDLQEAMDHIARYGTLHSEAIVTENEDTAHTFLMEVDAAAVYHNASTRFTDGFEFGFGAEIGISTQKLHARGPMGLRELTSYKYLVYGSGQVRS